MTKKTPKKVTNQFQAKKIMDQAIDALNSYDGKKLKKDIKQFQAKKVTDQSVDTLNSYEKKLKKAVKSLGSLTSESLPKETWGRFGGKIGSAILGLVNKMTVEQRIDIFLTVLAADPEYSIKEYSDKVHALLEIVGFKGLDDNGARAVLEGIKKHNGLIPFLRWAIEVKKRQSGC